jgi:hypothetical protein
MRATLIYGAYDVRVEDVPDAALREPTDAVVRVLRSCRDCKFFGVTPEEEGDHCDRCD